MSDAESANNGVYFLSLELENVRCFGKKQKLDLSDGKGNPAQWTVILGNNGTGKTTLLQVLYENSKTPVFVNKSLHRIGADYPQLECNRAYNNILEKKQGKFLQHSEKRIFSKDVDGGDIHKSISSPSDGKFPFNEHKPTIFIYSASRTPKLNNSKENARFYDDLINAESWLKDTYLFSEAKSQFKERFNSVKKTLVNLLPDVEEIDIYYPDENKPELKVRFLVNNVWLSLDALSLGYQSMITWVVDLAARLFNFYPESKNPIEDPAVVLIDEIDLHLHPKWQREIMRYLSERFINTQFIVTAHSPLIVQAAEDENANIVVLRREGDEVIIDQQPKAIHGWRVDQLLASDLFGLEGSRSKKYEELLTKRRAILGKSKLTAQDKKDLKKLELEMGDIPTAETPENIKAMDIIRRAAKLLEAEND